MVTGSKSCKNKRHIETCATGIPVTTVRTENRVTTFSLDQNNRIKGAYLENLFTALLTFDLTIMLLLYCCHHYIVIFIITIIIISQSEPVNQKPQELGLSLCKDISVF